MRYPAKRRLSREIRVVRVAVSPGAGNLLKGLARVDIA